SVSTSCTSRAPGSPDRPVSRRCDARTIRDRSNGVTVPGTGRVAPGPNSSGSLIRSARRSVNRSRRAHRCCWRPCRASSGSACGPRPSKVSGSADYPAQTQSRCRTHLPTHQVAMSQTIVHPAGWYADPTGRHQHRYWDGAAWTDHVADDGVRSIDALESHAPEDFGVEEVAAEEPWPEEVEAQHVAAREVRAEEAAADA